MAEIDSWQRQNMKKTGDSAPSQLNPKLMPSAPTMHSKIATPSHSCGGMVHGGKSYADGGMVYMADGGEVRVDDDGKKYVMQGDPESGYRENRYYSLEDVKDKLAGRDTASELDAQARKVKDSGDLGVGLSQNGKYEQAKPAPVSGDEDESDKRREAINALAQKAAEASKPAARPVAKPASKPASKPAGAYRSVRSEGGNYKGADYDETDRLSKRSARPINRLGNAAGVKPKGWTPRMGQ